MLDGESDLSLEPVRCGDDCPVMLELEVLRSNAGYYIGRFCGNDGPHSRLSDYFRTREDAQAELDLMWKEADVRPSGRDTEFHG